ncbi:MAG: hypothetical protein A3G83_04835 [Betaproteobacteria bacterium RIFCSPLOWO2_12_FULL_68_20]|nr:MAG: hypothetical protein A3G83_04835 [Betaproteobacteria bacterium RIFCSPLOWO2_12_FULL_68_20]
MAATARIPVQVTPEEKAKIARRAKAVGLTVGEFARRAMASFDAEESASRDMERLLERVKASTARASKAIDEALRFVAESQQRIERLEAAGTARNAA